MTLKESGFEDLLKGHRMGVEDAIYGLKHMLTRVEMEPAQKQIVFELLNNLVILPTRVYREVVDGNLTR